MKKAKEKKIKVALSVITVVLLTVAVYLGLGLKDKVPSKIAPDGGTVEVDLTRGNPFLGNADAKVTIQEFTDLQCLYCRKFFKETFPEIKENYIDTGLVKYVFAEKPLTMLHKDSLSAAISLECARDQKGDDAYLAMRTKIFEAQIKEADEVVEISRESLATYATELELDLDEFTTCMDEAWFQPLVIQDIEAALELDISATPGFTVNDKKFTGSRDFDYFKNIIDEELAKIEE